MLEHRAVVGLLMHMQMDVCLHTCRCTCMCMPIIVLCSYRTVRVGLLIKVMSILEDIACNILSISHHIINNNTIIGDQDEHDGGWMMVRGD